MDSVDLLRELSRKFAHRGMGTPEEREAALWLAGKLRDMGYDAAVQPFRATRDNLYLLPAQVFLGAVAACAAALLTPLPWIGLLPLAYAIAVLLAETSGYAVDLTPMPRFASQNVVTAPSRRAGRTLFVTAHYDTQRGSFLFHPRFVDRLPLFFNACYASLALAILGVLAAAAALPGSGYVLWAALVCCAGACAVYLAAEITGRYTPGANDNGTGVALALWLASEYAARPETFPAECDLRFVFTGSEEAGCRGMKAFLQSRREPLDPRRERFVNLDNLGAGAVTYLSGEGMLFYRRAGPAMLAIARGMRAETNAGGAGREVREQPNLLLPTDALPPSARGLAASSFRGKDAAGRLGNYHWLTDTFENVDAAFLRFQQQFFGEFIRRAMAAPSS